MPLGAYSLGAYNRGPTVTETTDFESRGPLTELGAYSLGPTVWGPTIWGPTVTETTDFESRGALTELGPTGGLRSGGLHLGAYSF